MKDDRGPVSKEAPVATTSSSQKPAKSSDPAAGLEDGRELWDWQSKYPAECKPLIRREAILVGAYLFISLIVSGILASLGGSSFELSFNETTTLSISSSLLMTFAVGALGGTTFSIKWLMHSVATGKWHIDRLYWRIFVPLVGGVYAVIVMELFAGGFLGRVEAGSLGTTAAFAFLLGYFSDGVSGLLTNVANAVFGTVEKK